MGIFGQDAVQRGEIRLRQARCGMFQQARLQQRAQLEGLAHLLCRKGRDGSALVRGYPHEALGLQLEQRLAHRDAADAEFLGKAVLAELRAGRIAPVQHAAADLLQQGGRDGAVLQRRVHPVSFPPFRHAAGQAGA